MGVERMVANTCRMQAWRSDFMIEGNTEAVSTRAVRARRIRDVESVVKR